MTWTSPPTVATGDIYTAAMFNTYTRDNPNHLRALTGGADPGSANKSLLSDGSASALWTSVVDTTIFNAIKVNAAANGATTFAALLGANKCGFWEVSPAADGPFTPAVFYCINMVSGINPAIYGWQIAQQVDGSSQTYFRLIVAGSPTSWFKIWHENDDGAGSGLNADLLDNLNSGNASGNIPISNGTQCVNLNAQLLQGLVPGNSNGNIGLNNSVVNVNMNADMVDSHHAADITPNNARVWFDTVAQLTAAGAHWSRDTALDGRLTIGGDEEGNDAGMAVFTPGSNYGSSWFPYTTVTPTIGTLAATKGSLDVDPGPGTNTDSNTNTATATAAGGGAIVVPVAHVHTYTAATQISGAPALTGAPGVTGTFWLPLMRAGVYGKKA